MTLPTAIVTLRGIKGRWLVWTGLALAGLVVLFAPWPITSAAPRDRTLRIEAHRFDYAPSVISVNPGDRVTLELISLDVVHGVYIDGYSLSLTADPGQSARLTFLADRPGTFRFRCSVTCGPLHPFMIGKLTVGPNELVWRTAGLAALAVLAGLWMVRR